MQTLKQRIYFNCMTSIHKMQQQMLKFIYKILNKNGGIKMKQSIYKSYDELPLILNAETIKNVLGISLTSAYELMHEKDFPSIKIGSRIIVPKDKFREWIDKKSGG